jgi:hypothetical protein
MRRGGRRRIFNEPSMQGTALRPGFPLNAMAVNTSTCRNASDFIPKSPWLRGRDPEDWTDRPGCELVAEHMSGQEICREHGADRGNHRIRRRSTFPTT